MISVKSAAPDEVMGIMPARLRGRENGFTLIQILIALVIVGIALIPASHVFTTSNRQVVRSQGLLEATLAAQSLLDTVLRDSFIMAHAGHAVNVPNENYPQLKILPHFRNKFRARAEISFREAPTTYNTRNLREIAVRIFWNENGVTMESSLETMKANINDILLTVD